MNMFSHKIDIPQQTCALHKWTGVKAQPKNSPHEDTAVLSCDFAENWKFLVEIN